MKIKILTSFIFLLLLSAPIYAQETFNRSLLSLGSTFPELSGKVSGEVGFIWARVAESSCSNPMGFAGVKASTEFLFGPTSKYIAPKAGVQFDLLFFGARLSLADYTDLRTHDFRLSPEVGLTALGLIDVFYKWNVPLTKAQFAEVPRESITATLNLDLTELIKTPKKTSHSRFK